jgi:hypothetical protein
MAEQTAVEWLVEQLKIEEGIDFIPTSLFERAKEMEKQRERMHEQQIKEAYGHGHNNGCSYLYGGVPIDAEEYYQQTYGTK